MSQRERAELKHGVWMGVAESVAALSTCLSGQVGVVITDTRGIVASTGVNGAPTGLPHCSDPGVGCLFDERGKCVRTIHAERNAILWADRWRLDGSTLYTSRRPCLDCASMMVQVGVAHLFFPEGQELEPEPALLLARAGVESRVWRRRIC